MASQSSRSDKHIWTREEDELLLQCLLEMRDKNILAAENGFRPGHLTQLQEMIREKSPGCGIRAIPHIQSRLKTLRISYNTVYDLLNTSGFGWDPVNKYVTADQAVWDEYVKVSDTCP